MGGSVDFDVVGAATPADILRVARVRVAPCAPYIGAFNLFGAFGDEKSKTAGF